MTTRLIVALTAMLALAGCGGGGNGGGTTAEDIRKRTGSTPPLETADEQRERAGEIVSRADLMMMSPIHGEAANATGLPTFRVLADCSSEACEFGEPSVGFSDYFTIGDLTNNLRAATFALAKHGITLFEIHEGASDGSFTAYGSWMDHSGFSVNAFTSHVFVPFRHGMAGGDLTGERPAATATWTGLMVGTPATGPRRNNLLQGDAAVTYDFSGSLDASFTNITDITRNRAHSMRTIRFDNVPVHSRGTFFHAGSDGSRIEGAFYGPGHAEATGVFEKSNVVGAFGAKK